MNIALGVLVGLLTVAILVAVVAFITRRSYLVKRLNLTLYVGALAAGLGVFAFIALPLLSAGRRADLESSLSWVVMMLGALAVLQIAGLYFFDVYLHSQRGVRLPPLLPMVAKGLAYVVALLVTFQIAFPDRDVTTLLAASAITSLVLGLALQPILGNFFSGIVISLEKPFRINDWIELEGNDGLVTNITWRTTHLRTRENDSLVIPNSAIAGQQITNYHYPHPLHMERIYVGVHYRTPPYRVQEALQQAAKTEGVLDKPTPEVHLKSFDDSAITYELRIWFEDHATKPRIVSDVKKEIWENFRNRGIVIPFPIRTLEFASQMQPFAVVQPTGDASRDPVTKGDYIAKCPPGLDTASWAL